MDWLDDLNYYDNSENEEHDWDYEDEEVNEEYDYGADGWYYTIDSKISDYHIDDIVFVKPFHDLPPMRVIGYRKNQVVVKYGKKNNIELFKPDEILHYSLKSLMTGKDKYNITLN